MAHIKNITKQTGCIYLKYNCVPFFKLNDTEWVLMDSGTKYDERELFQCLESEHATIYTILTSHAHYDHIGNHKALKARYNSTIIMSAFDAGMVHDAVSMKSAFYSSCLSEITEEYNEMIMNADFILPPESAYIDIKEYRFQIFPINGHAASQLAFVTPDQVVYLADSLQSPECIQKNRLTYMLDWTYAFRTLDSFNELSYKYYVLSHRGVYQNISPIISSNKELFLKQIGIIRDALTEEMTLENLVIKIHSVLTLRAESFVKYHVTERAVRSMVEYLVEHGLVKCCIKDNQIVYRTD